jgi:hypothetical protein
MVKDWKDDLRKGRSVNQVLTDYEKRVILSLKKIPKTQFYLQSILLSKNLIIKRNKDVREINKGIIELAKTHFFECINFFDLFKTKYNEFNMDYSFIGLHLNDEGYLLWKGGYYTAHRK